MCPFQFSWGREPWLEFNIHSFISVCLREAQPTFSCIKPLKPTLPCGTSYPCPLGSRAEARDVTWPPLFYFAIPQLSSLLHYKVQRKINPTVITCHLFCIISSWRQTLCMFSWNSFDTSAVFRSSPQIYVRYPSWKHLLWHVVPCTASAVCQSSCKIHSLVSYQ